MINPLQSILTPLNNWLINCVKNQRVIKFSQQRKKNNKLVILDLSFEKYKSFLSFQ